MERITLLIVLAIWFFYFATEGGESYYLKASHLYWSVLFVVVLVVSIVVLMVLTQPTFPVFQPSTYELGGITFDYTKISEIGAGP